MDILERLEDLKKQATTERSHCYTARVVQDAIEEITLLRANQTVPEPARNCENCPARYGYLYCQWMKNPEGTSCINWGRLSGNSFVPPMED